LQAYWKNVLKWRNPGYHYVVLPDGTYRSIHDIALIANGVAGHNRGSIHCAYIGGIDANGKPIDNRTPAQKQGLIDLLKVLKARFPAAEIVGHRDLSPDKNNNGKVDAWERIKHCPCFDAIPEYASI
jgi:N-acetylmuramoyl-L-alanine amidase